MKKKNSTPIEKSSFRDYAWSLKGIRMPILMLMLVFAFSLLSTYAGVNLSMFTGDMVDAGGNVPTSELIKFSIFYILIGVAAAGNLLASAYASEKVNLGLRSKLWRKIMYTSQHSFDRDCGESLVSRVTTDCDYASKLLIILVEMLGTIISLYMYVSKMYNLNVKLANAMWLLIPVSVLCGWIYAKLNFIVAQKTQLMLSGTTTYLAERTRSLTLIKTANAQQEETAEGLKHFDKQFGMQIKTGLMTTGYIAMQEAFSILSLLIPFLIGAGLVANRVIRPGVVIAFYSMATSAGTVATQLISNVGSIRQANGALARVITLLKTPDEHEKKGMTLDVPDQDITLEEVDFAYGEKPVLKRVKCNIPKKKVTAIIGSNGSGKSTLFKLIDRLYEPDNGKMAFGSTNAQEYDLHEWRKAFCLVAQDSPLMEGTVRDNICYGVERPISQEELEHIARQARVYDFVAALPDGFDTHVTPGGTNFSGGQRQLIAIARAMMNNPDYLLLDEATSSLDAHSERMVMEALEALMQDRTTVIIAHSLSAIRNADHVIVLRDGQTESEGAPDAILNKTDNYLSKVMNRRENRA